MLNGLRLRLQALKGAKDQHLANLNAMIGREQELVELIEKLEKLQLEGVELPKIEEPIPPVPPIDDQTPVVEGLQPTELVEPEESNDAEVTEHE